MFFKAPDMKRRSRFCLRNVISVTRLTGVSHSPVGEQLRYWDRLHVYEDVEGLCRDLEAVYPAGWRVVEGLSVCVVISGVDVRVSRCWEEGLVDMNCSCSAQGVKRLTLENLPDGLAKIMVEVVRSGNSFDPASVPDWLRGALKEAFRLEHERIDRLFRGL